MENVKGFDKDLARDQFVETLRELNYNYQVNQFFFNFPFIFFPKINRTRILKGVSFVSYPIRHTELQIEVFSNC